jgi:hypothetical protein
MGYFLRIEQRINLHYIWNTTNYKKHNYYDSVFSNVSMRTDENPIYLILNFK